MGNIIKTYSNKADGITSYVVGGANNSFNVAMKDDDAGEFIGSVKIFSNKADAIKYAKYIVA